MNHTDIENTDTLKNIVVKGAKVHNLKNIDIIIPKDKFTVITGLSGSGKSSLAFDTLYAEGQRRYVESLSSYARQFLARMNKTEVEYIKGITPAIAIQQKVYTTNPRSTVGTSTEIYEYLKLLFAKIGKTYSPVSGNIVKKHSTSDVVDYILSLSEGVKVTIYSPYKIIIERPLKEQLYLLLQQGYSRISYDKKTVRVEEAMTGKEIENIPSSFNIVIDRIKVDNSSDETKSRIADSVETAFFEGRGKCIIESDSGQKKEFSNQFELDGIKFEEPSANLFSFNNPYGACKHCEGFGSVMGIDEDLVIPDKSLSVYDGAVLCWRGEKMSRWKERLVMNAYKFDFPIHKPYHELTSEQKEILWNGNKHIRGINTFFKFVERKSYKIQYRVMLSRYRGKTACPSCKGSRLRKDAEYVKINNKSISELSEMPVSRLLSFFKTIKLNEHEKQVSKRMLTEITNRLQYLEDAGLGYLTLNRLANTLSGGESQRINLANSLGSNLVGSMYILDEPSIGLHPRDTHRLIKILMQLRDLGNTVIVVEHDEEIIKAADNIIDIGPYAGTNGGEVICSGTYKELLKEKNSLTSQYLNKHLKIAIPAERRKWKEYIEVTGARENNLKNINVKFPLNTLTVVTGVSGSGKSSLVNKILYASLKKKFDGYREKTGEFTRLEGDINNIQNIEFVNQNPIGRSSRSNPATYVKAYDDIRELYAAQQLSEVRGYKPGFFSFNIKGGRCEECQGEGTVNISMQFMADVELICDECNGKRYKDEVLDIKYRGRNITDILEMTIDEAVEFFSSANEENNTIEKRIVAKLKPLQETGMGYVKMGQPSSTLSGGEAQRVKLASFLTKGNTDKPTLFIFDEPTTGLHFHDINKLLFAFDALIKNRHSLIVIEHNMEVIKCADWIIDLGPEGGEKGGYVVYEGTPEDIVKCKESYTGNFLKNKL